MDDSAYNADDLKAMGQKWLERIESSEKREESWIKAAQKAEWAYLVDREAEDGEVPSFNILHSNVETIVPATINSPPQPDVRPRHNNPDQLGKFIADVIERGISTQIDDGRLMREAEKVAQDAFLTGRGVIRMKLDATLAEEIVTDEMGQPILDEEGEPLTQEVVSDERVLFENVSWRDYREGPAKAWRDVPWVAYRHYVSKEELERLSDEELAKLQMEADQKDDEESEDDACIWEIWCKESQTVKFIADTGKVLSIQEPPLELSGFFPQPEPVQPITGTGKRTPVCPYAVYETLAKELDTVTKRINRITSGMKVRGLIAGDATDVAEVANLDDWELAPVQNLEGLVATRGIENAVMWYPIDKAITVLRELYAAREQIKQSIYEITGISDIVRGASQSQETATAQQIKTQWGSLRIRKLQRLIEHAMRDTMVISAEIMWSSFQPSSLAKAAGVPMVPELEQAMQGPLDHYRIDIETDSTVRSDLTQKREEMARFLEGTAAYFNTMAPLIEQSPEAAGPIADIYSAFARQFDLGKQAEDALDQLLETAKQSAQQPRENPEAQKMQMEMQAKQAELQLKQQEAQADMQKSQAEIQLKRQEAEHEAQIKNAEIQFKREELNIDWQRLELEKAKFSTETARQDAEMSMQHEEREAEMGEKMSQSGSALVQALQGPLEALMQQIQQGQAQLSQQISEGNAQVVETIRAPKELVRDAQGRPTGVRIVQ